MLSDPYRVLLPCSCLLALGNFWYLPHPVASCSLMTCCVNNNLLVACCLCVSFSWSQFLHGKGCSCSLCHSYRPLPSLLPGVFCNPDVGIETSPFTRSSLAQCSPSIPKPWGTCNSNRMGLSTKSAATNFF